MKRLVFLAMFLFIGLVSVSAQGFYFDIGIGVGLCTTEIDNEDVYDALYFPGIKEIAVDVGLKAGYGPIGGLPIYIVGDLSAVGHRMYDSDNYIQFNSYLIGPGIIFYPIPKLQLALSLGYSFAANDTDMPFIMAESDSGGALSFSVAYDIGKGNHGCLIGIRGFFATNELETKVDQDTYYFGIFVRYAYRQKITKS